MDCSQSSPDSGRSQLLPHVIYNQVVFGKKNWLLLNLAKRLVFFGAIALAVTCKILLPFQATIGTSIFSVKKCTCMYTVHSHTSRHVVFQLVFLLHSELLFPWSNIFNSLNVRGTIYIECNSNHSRI